MLFDGVATGFEIVLLLSPVVGLHKYVPPPVALKLDDVPLHILSSLLIPTIGRDNTVSKVVS